MSKITIEFDSYEEREELDCALNGGKYRAQVDEIWQVLFRPRHKHGYSNGILQECLGMEVAEEEMTEAQKACNALMDALEQMYREIRHEE